MAAEANSYDTWFCAQVQAALEDARQRDKRVVPQCEFIAKYIERHAQWQDLVDPA